MGINLLYRIDGVTVAGVGDGIDVNYLLDDGYLLPVDQSPAWCRDCNRLRMVEDLPTVERAVTEFTNADRYTLRVFQQSSLAFAIAMWHRRRCEWRLKRSSPAKCFYCGGTNYFQIVENRCCDPVAGHEFQFIGMESYEPALPLPRIRLSPEGDVIESEFVDLKR